MKTKRFVRSVRGWIYRRFPCWNETLYRKKRVGYERRWNLEIEGFTKEGFFDILQDRFCLKDNSGSLVELCVGDGLTGSLGLWLEASKQGWKVQAWEHRPLVLRQLRHNRPRTDICEGRLTDWSTKSQESKPDAITTRATREAAAVCRGIRRGFIRPKWIGIWNPSQRSVWYRRLTSNGYKLCVAWHNMEFYLRKAR
jgi:hypothetical protein